MFFMVINVFPVTTLYSVVYYSKYRIVNLRSVQCVVELLKKTLCFALGPGW